MFPVQEPKVTFMSSWKGKTWGFGPLGEFSLVTLPSVRTHRDTRPATLRQIQGVRNLVYFWAETLASAIVEIERAFVEDRVRIAS
jgi:hypothetical protein